MAAPKPEYPGDRVYVDEKINRSPSNSDHAIYDDTDGQHERLGFWTRMGCTPDSFKRRSLDKHGQLNQTLKSRHLHMIAIGGSIGAGLFVGSGSALTRGGPAALLIAFGIIGIMIFNVVYALGELAIMYPISGGFYTYSTRFIDPSWGFAMGWNYVFQWAIVLPLELVVAALTMEFWEPNISTPGSITVFLVAIVVINIFGVLGFGEEEFWSSLLKLTAIVIFIFIGIIFVCGGGPSNGLYSEYSGARTWYNPGAFANGFKGVCSVFVTAAFAFSGTELVGLAAAESKTPSLSLPGAVKQVFWRITLFYILSLLFVGLLVEHTNPRLLGSGSFGANAEASPFVIAAQEGGLIGFDSFFNVVILISVISIGNSGVYGGSRTLTALAEQGYAPRIFAYIDQAGRPLFSTIFVIAFGCLAYLSSAAASVEIFDWLLALSGLAALFTWGSICLAHIRFRHAWRYHGHTLEEIPFRSMFGEAGSWVGLGLIAIVLVAQFYVALFPLGGAPPDPKTFFKAYLALPVVILFWIIGYAWKRQGWLRTAQIDVDTGRRPFDFEKDAQEKARIAASSFPKRMYHLFC